MTLTSSLTKSDGFTLVEMLVVLTIVGLVLTLAVGAIGKRPSQSKRDIAVNLLRQSLDSAKAASRGNGRPVEVPLHEAGPDGQPATIRSDLAPAERLLVFPDGSTNGGIVSAAGAPLATIDWLSGTVRAAH